MSPVQHPISGPSLALDLAEELRVVHEQLATTSRTARTLVKNGALRVTLMGIAAGGALAAHSADGPITVHVLEGTIEFEADGKTWMLPAGSLFALDAGIVHSVRAPQGGVFLLTVAVARAG
jgi:quercetin dioxygenase-like cupin family protein